MLQQLGITTYRQIARWTERDIDEFDTKLAEFPGRIRRDGWVTQARALHAASTARRRPPETGERSLGDRARARAPACRVAARHGGALIPIAVVTLLWGCNWPVLKMGVPEIPPLTFRALTLPLSALGLLLIARAAGDSIRLPRPMWGKVAMLALFNCTGWNGLAAVRPPAAARRTRRHPRIHDAGLEHAHFAAVAARAAVAAQDPRPFARHAGHGTAPRRRCPASGTRALSRR
jgi:hypothetical protein